MAPSVLVTYATRYGSTREVAESIAATLQKQGLTVEVQAASKVQSVESYSCVVLGTPFYVGQMLKDAKNFLARHQALLQKRPVFVFVVGPLEKEEEKWQGVRDQIEKEFAKYSWLKPTEVKLFGGKYNPAKLNFLDNMLKSLPASPLYQIPESDARNWDDIQAWSESLAAKI